MTVTLPRECRRPPGRLTHVQLPTPAQFGGRMHAIDARRNEAGGSEGPVVSLLLLTASVLAVFFGLYQLLETYVLAPRYEMRVLHLLHIIRGITGSVLAAGFVAYYMIRHSSFGFRGSEQAAGTLDQHERQLDHVRWFVQMRWVAAGFTLALIVIAVPLTSILAPRHLPQLLAWWLFLILANLFFARMVSSGVAADTQIVTQVVVDLIILTGLLNASGGIENPLSIAYLFHVIIAGILLPARKAFGIALVASGIFCALAAAELFHLLPHSTILLFPHAPAGNHIPVHAAHDLVFVVGKVVSFVGVMLLTSYFTTLVSGRLRRSETDLEIAARKAVLDHSKLEGVIDAAELGIVVVGQDSRVQWFNPRLAGWMGWDQSKAGATLAHEHDNSTACMACLTNDVLGDGQKRDAEACIRSAENGCRYFRHVASPVRDGDGQVMQVVDVIEEVTHKKALEAEALHVSKLSVLGQLAAGVAHEIGNPLSSLHARLQLMKRRDDPAFVQESLTTLQTQIDRIGRIVRGVSNLARKPGDASTSVDLNALLEEALSLVRFDKRAGAIDFKTSLQTDLPHIRGVREQLMQVFINLLLNAVESMPNGGCLEVTSRMRGDTVAVSVSDTGVGFGESVRVRLFEPFFTTKQEGTGLGLSICYSLVHAHGGSIEVRSESGRGSSFSVNLPACAPAPKKREAVVG
jgi:signal transduction histidine kinase